MNERLWIGMEFTAGKPLVVKCGVAAEIGVVQTGTYHDELQF
jgi:hypothetical protein